MTTIPETHKDILQGKNFAHLATLMPDGSPQVTPVWVDLETDGTVVINTSEGRQKARNLDRDGRVALSVSDSSNPYRYIQIRGQVISKSPEDGDEVIDRLAKKYMGVDTYPNRVEGEQRVTYRIRPDRVQTMG